MKIHTVFYVWLVAMIQKFKGDLPAPLEEKQYQPLKLDLQFFAESEEDDDGDGEGGDDEEEDEEDDGPDLNELLKDKKFKKQLSEHTKGILGKRLKKYEDVDIEEYKALKAAADKAKGKGKKGDDDEGEDNELQQKLKDREARLAKAETREKRAMVKEFAIDQGVSPKLLARLMDTDKIELDDDGEPENLDELFEELEEEFPEFLSKSSNDDDEEDDEPSKKKYAPGNKKKNLNKQKKVDKSAIGKNKAAQLYGKKEEAK